MLRIDIVFDHSCHFKFEIWQNNLETRVSSKKEKSFHKNFCIYSHFVCSRKMRKFSLFSRNFGSICFAKISGKNGIWKEIKFHQKIFFWEYKTHIPRKKSFRGIYPARNIRRPNVWISFLKHYIKSVTGRTKKIRNTLNSSCKLNIWLASSWLAGFGWMDRKLEKSNSLHQTLI